MGSHKKDDQGRRWCFTFYNEDDLRKLREFPLDALVVALEVGEKEQHEHYQGYVKFGSNRRWSWWEKVFHCHPPLEDGSKNPLNSAHWNLAKGREWKCRRYIVDVEAYMRDEPDSHFKTQGKILHDFGCEVVLDESASVQVQVIKMCVDGAKASQIFREHPVFYFHNCRKIRDLRDDISLWKQLGEEYKPSRYDEPRKRIKAESSSSGENAV